MAKTTKSTLFKLPSAEDWNNLVKDLGLSQTQANELDILIRHVHADLEHHRLHRVDLGQELSVLKAPRSQR